MRHIALSSTLALTLLTACGQAPQTETAAPQTAPEAAIPETPAMPHVVTKAEIAPPAPDFTANGYDATWGLTPDWPGEWPSGFSITNDNLILQARATLDKAAPRNVSCPLPQYMNVHQWNYERNETENWSFVSAEKQTRIEIIKDVTVASDFDGPVLNLKAGDIGIFKQYHSEGAFTSTWDGRDFVAYFEYFGDAAKFEQSPPADLWVNVRCHDGNDTRAWLLLSDIAYTEGVGSSYLENFGGARDLMAETVAENQRKAKEQGVTPGDPTAPAPYDPNQYAISDFWAGEYPSGFAIARKDVTLYGYDDVVEGFSPTTACPMPHKAAYHPWNSARNEADQIIYKSVVWKTKITMKTDKTVSARKGETDMDLALKSGDQITFISGLGENYFIGEYDGQQYALYGGEFGDAVADFPQPPQPEEWVNVACTDGTRAWLKYGDVIKAYGVRVHGSQTYGTASDLP